MKRRVEVAIQEGIAIQLHPSWQTVGNAGPTTGRIKSTGRFDKIGHQIRQCGTYDIGLKYDGRRLQLWRWAHCHRGDNTGDQSIKKETAIRKPIVIKEVIDIVIGNQVCDRG